jgi:N-methylhydantoinase B
MKNKDIDKSPRAIDAVTLEILGNRLLSVSEEMGAALIRTAYSTNIKERRDCSTAIFNAEGHMIAQAEHIPMHLGSLLGAVSSVLDKYQHENIKPGDMFITNDPYYGGGTHLPDITLVSPVFNNNHLIGFVANIAHHSDVGGKVPGSTSGDATSIYQEGTRIPLVRVCRGGKILTDIIDFITLNSRTPTEREGDLAAQISANDVGVRRLSEVVDYYGHEKFSNAVLALLDYSEDLMRTGITELPEGKFEFEDFLDDDGITLGEPVPIRVKIAITGDCVIVDFNGSSPQVDGPVNVPFNATLATVFYCFKAIAGINIPSNTGTYRALKVRAPKGTIVNCLPPAAVGERVDACQRIADVIFGAMAKAVPNRVVAASNSSVTTATFSGYHPDTNGFYVYLEAIAGGQGAHSSGDGLSGVQVHMTNTSNLPIEALEREYPLLVERYTLRIDSGGAGEYRGGLGIRRDIRALHEGVTFSSLADRQRIPPWGLDGGHAGAPGEFILIRKDGDASRVGAKASNIKLNEGDLISVRTPGAGGFGDPYRRKLESVQIDIAEGSVSAEAAQSLYGVAFFPDGSIDANSTQVLREKDALK